MKNIEDIYELSPMQQGILFQTLYAPGSGVYSQQLTCTLRGALNVTAFKHAWQKVADRHTILRSEFYWEELPKPLQVVLRGVELPWEQRDLRNLDPVRQRSQLQDYLHSEIERGFELDRAPLMRLSLIRLEEEIHRFICSFHHLLVDGWSWPIIIKEVSAFYGAFIRGEVMHMEAPRPYRSYISWLQRQDLSRAETYWRETLDGFTVPTPLPADRTGGAVSGRNPLYEERSIRVPEHVTARLGDLLRRQHLTLSALLNGVWAILLSRYSGEEDVMFGAVVSGRQVRFPGVESMVGIFINTLPARVRITHGTGLLPWLEQLMVQQVEREEHACSPLVDIQKWSGVQRDRAMFESIVVFENYPLDASVTRPAAGLEMLDFESFARTNYPLVLIAEPGEEIHLRMSYHGDRIDSGAADQMLGHFAAVLEEISENPERPPADIPLVRGEEMERIEGETGFGAGGQADEFNF